jgi:uncharacterized protein
MPPAAPAHPSRVTAHAISAYLALWAASVTLLYQREHSSIAEPILIFLVLGVGFSLVAWLFTRSARPLPFQVRHPLPESLFLGVWLLVILAWLTWGIPSSDTAPGSTQLLLSTIKKLLIFVILPFAGFILFWHYRPSELLPSAPARHLPITLGMSAIMLAFQCIFGAGLHQIRDAHLPVTTLLIGTPLAFLFLMLETGLVEEFFFRVLLQSRLEALLKSVPAGILSSALLFGLVHAPGLYLRTAHTNESLGPNHSLLAAIAYSIAYTSVAGIFLGVLWARTRNLFLIVTVHAATDILPNLVSLIHTF